MCGEKLDQSSFLPLSPGSPPRVRGKGSARQMSPVAPRITPACAGKSHPPTVQADTGGDHPRVCGEKDLEAELAAAKIGSPPRVRGKALPWRKYLPDFGITPACAGKSLQDRYPRQAGEDHPRVCGEKLTRLPSDVSTIGSPPRVRGKVSSSDQFQP